MSLSAAKAPWVQRPVLYVAGVFIWLCFMRGAARELHMIAPPATNEPPAQAKKPHQHRGHRRDHGHRSSDSGAAHATSPHRDQDPHRDKGPHRGKGPPHHKPQRHSKHARKDEEREQDDHGPRGTEALPLRALVTPNQTTFRTRGGQCVRRAVALPSMSCSLPECDRTRSNGRLRVLTNPDKNTTTRVWMSYLRFDLSGLSVHAGARLVDAELLLFGTAKCHGALNFTHQLHLLRSQQVPSAIELNRPFPRRLTAQWSSMVTAANYRVPLNLNGRQLLMLSRHRRLNFAISEKLFGLSSKHAIKGLSEACSYYSSSAVPMLWPRLHLSYAWRCCLPPGAGPDDVGDGAQRISPVERRRRRRARYREAAAADAAREGDEADRGAAGSYAEGENATAPSPDGVGGSGEGARVERPAWISRADWARLDRSKRLPLPWHSALAASPAEWVYDAHTDARPDACVPPAGRSDAQGGQLAVPSGTPPEVSFIVLFHNNENMTAQCARALFACASEVPSSEFLFVDDGSTEPSSGELASLLSSLAATYGIRYEILRYRVSVGFTLAASEAARRANGTYILFLNNDAFVQRNSLRAIYQTFFTHADVGVVGGKLVALDETTQEAGAIVWADATGAWFLKSSQLYRGRANDRNHRLAYVRETDYVSAACAMVHRALFLKLNMFDMHFSPGYYEDTDLSMTMRANGLRVLYQPFAKVYHQAHSTYKASMDQLLEKNRQHFVSKWTPSLRGHMPPCNVASACGAQKTMYTHLAATRLYSFRMLWVDMILPEPDRDSGSVRTLTMIKLLLGMRVHVSIVTVQRSGKGRHDRYTRMLQYLGVHVIPSFRMFRTFTVREPYDFILIARRDTFAAVRDTLHRHYPNTLTVFDTVDLHFVRERMRRDFFASHANESRLLADIFGKQASRLSDEAEHARLRELELDAVSASSVAVVVSERERVALLEELANDGREEVAVTVIANAHEPAAPTATPFDGRAGLVFVGNFNHLPNRDAVLFFSREVMPLLLRDPNVAADPDFVFHVVGSNALPASVAELNSSRIVVHGYVPTLRGLYSKMRVSVAPLRWGAGVKGKVNTAHQLGVPVIATSTAVDGMHAVNGTHVLVGDTPAELARAVLLAYYDARVWRRLVSHGRRLLESRFSASRAAVGLLQARCATRINRLAFVDPGLELSRVMQREARPAVVCDRPKP